jgi:iron complex transport system substrate-binding protein
MNRFLFLCCISILISCDSKVNPQIEQSVEVGGVLQPIKYAKGFEITKFEGYSILKILNSFKGNNQQFEYLISTDSAKVGKSNLDLIKAPVGGIAALSSTYIPFIKLLGELNSIVAVSGKNTIYDSLIYSRAKAGEIKDLGEPTLNVEQTIVLNPDLIMGFAIDAKSMKQLLELKRLNQKVLINSEYMEATPLAKAEWIKVFGLIYNKQEQADSIFKTIEARYLNLLKQVEQVTEKPTVFSSTPWKGTWFVPGGNSFQATLFNDAGANYIWKENTENVSLSLDFEVVLSKALSADYWLNTSNFQSLQEISDADERFELFSAFKNKSVYNNIKTLTPYYGNDYWETGAARPDLILEDLVHIFHPEINPNHVFNYYQKLD